MNFRELVEALSVSQKNPDPTSISQSDSRSLTLLVLFVAILRPSNAKTPARCMKHSVATLHNFGGSEPMGEVDYCPFR